MGGENSDNSTFFLNVAAKVLVLSNYLPASFGMLYLFFCFCSLYSVGVNRIPPPMQVPADKQTFLLEMSFHGHK